MNTDAFLRGQWKYFARSYEQFADFGGPCVYFHHECLRACATAFLSDRHVEMLYATLTAWGMHRMGSAARTKTKLANWERFSGSIAANAARLREFRGLSMLDAGEEEYLSAVAQLRPIYESLDLTEAKATVVVNSKALHHILPEFIPPIDRQYTIRFFTQTPDRWRDQSGKYRPVPLPPTGEAQFTLFARTCRDLKRMADRVDRALFEDQRRRYALAAPKALDNAILNYVRLVGGQRAAPSAECGRYRGGIRPATDRPERLRPLLRSSPGADLMM